MACKKCGRRNPFHTCYTGGGKSYMDLDPKTIDLIHKTVELNVARGHDPYKGLTSDQRRIYKNQS